MIPGPEKPDEPEDDRTAALYSPFGFDRTPRAPASERTPLPPNVSGTSRNIPPTKTGPGDSGLSPTAHHVPVRGVGTFRQGQLIFGKYIVQRPIGEGGMGTVLLVRHKDLDDDRALKMIVSEVAIDPRMRARFRREAQVLARLKHPNAVAVHNADLDNDVAFIEMEFVRGQTLDKVLKSGEPMPIDRVARILDQLCEVLQVAHDHDIVHRDLKPTNLMLLDGRPPGDDFLKVLDFGIAKILNPDGSSAEDVHTRTGVFIGTAQYSSPEQANEGTVDARSDIYSVGVILYELLTGSRPFTGPAHKQIYGHMALPPPPFAARNPNAAVPPPVERVVMRCLAKNPADRPQTARELAEQFRRALPGARKPPSRRRWLVALVILLVGLALAGALIGSGVRTRVELPPNSEPMPDARVVVDRRDPGSPRRYYDHIARVLPDGVKVPFVIVTPTRREDPEAFYMMETKVWNALFERFAQAHPEAVAKSEWRKGGLAKRKDLGVSDGRLPVLRVNVVEADRFAEWLGGRLPTVDEWNKAAGLDQSRAEGPFRGPLSAINKNHVAVDRGEEGPMPVGAGTKDVSSPFPCREMAGNGRELTSSVFEIGLDRRTVPLPHPVATDRVILRGRSYDRPDPLTYDQMRDGTELETQGYFEASPLTGFRVVLDAVR